MWWKEIKSWKEKSRGVIATVGINCCATCWILYIRLIQILKGTGWKWEIEKKNRDVKIKKWEFARETW